MRRISAVWKGRSGAAPEPSPPTQPSDKAFQEKPGTSWIVDDKFIEESSRLVPASPDDVDDVTRQVFLTRVFKGESWEDADVVLFGLGSALDIFPDKADFLDWKWIFVRNCDCVKEGLTGT